MASNTIRRMGRRGLLRLGAGLPLLAWADVPSAFAQRPAGGTPIKIGIIGSGHIGGTLGTLWARRATRCCSPRAIRMS